MSDEVTTVGDASITDDETVVVTDAVVAHESTTDGDRGVVGGVSRDCQRNVRRADESRRLSN